MSVIAPTRDFFPKCESAAFNGLRERARLNFEVTKQQISVQPRRNLVGARGHVGVCVLNFTGILIRLRLSLLLAETVADVSAVVIAK